MKNLILISLTLLSATLAGAQKKARVVDLRGQWKFNIGDNKEWANYAYNDEGWDNIFVPSRWENEGFGGYDGFAWYRTSFDFQSENKSDYYTLDLGYIDDCDEVYFNGELVGMSGGMPPNYRTAYDSRREYFIPNELIRWGKNTIAVRVYDRSLDGGIMNGQQGLFARKGLPSQVMYLDGIWKIRESDDEEWANKNYDDSEWDDVMVPGYWKNYKDFSFAQIIFSTKDRFWYRKTFELPIYLQNEDDLIITLGKIDDFDEVYLNGNLIGSTNDGLPYGRSVSYNQVRKYLLPDKYLNRYGSNTIAVRVTDIGNDAGIYQGPIAISTRDVSAILVDKF